MTKRNSKTEQWQEEMEPCIQSTVQEFMRFIQFVEERQPLLSAKVGVFGKKDSYELNDQLCIKRDVKGPNYNQDQYPVLDLMFHLSLLGGLYVRAANEKGKPVLMGTPALEQFRSLTVYEQYVFLVQTYWTKYPFEDTANYALYYYEILLRSMAGSKPGEQYSQDVFTQSGGLFFDCTVLLHHLRFFGWCELEKNPEAMGKYEEVITAVIPNAFGAWVIKFLTQKALPLWNVNIHNKTAKRHSLKADKASEHKCFLIFQGLLGSDRVIQTVSYGDDRDRRGMYYIKVGLSKQCWRIFKAAHHHSLDDLHTAIQQAFEFDNDHLYAFYFGGNRKTGIPVCCDEMEEPQYDRTRAVTLEDLGLYPGQKFYYLFDFGDRWEFEAAVQKIEPMESANRAATIQLIQSKGEAPQQYSW